MTRSIYDVSSEGHIPVLVALPLEATDSTDSQLRSAELTTARTPPLPARPSCVRVGRSCPFLTHPHHPSRHRPHHPSRHRQAPHPRPPGRPKRLWPPRPRPPSGSNPRRRPGPLLATTSSWLHSCHVPCCMAFLLTPPRPPKQKWNTSRSVRMSLLTTAAVAAAIPVCNRATSRRARRRERYKGKKHEPHGFS